jgi:predicted MFS family arabinose efflux permease
MTVSTAVLAAAPDGWVLGGLLLALGSFLAPSLVAGYLLADALTGEEVRTEAATWLTTACNAGAAAGAAVAGVLADSSGTTAAFLTGAALAAACVLGGASRAGSMRRPVDPASVPAGTTSRQE